MPELVISKKQRFRLILAVMTELAITYMYQFSVDELDILEIM